MYCIKNPEEVASAVSSPSPPRVPELIVLEFPFPPFPLLCIWPPPRALSTCSPFTWGGVLQATPGGSAAVAVLCPCQGTGSGGHCRRKLDSGVEVLPGGSLPPVPATTGGRWLQLRSLHCLLVSMAAAAPEGWVGRERQRPASTDHPSPGRGLIFRGKNAAHRL